MQAVFLLNMNTIEQNIIPSGPFIICGEKKVCLQDLLSSLAISTLIEYFRLGTYCIAILGPATTVACVLRFKYIKGITTRA